MVTFCTMMSWIWLPRSRPVLMRKPFDVPLMLILARKMLFAPLTASLPTETPCPPLNVAPYTLTLVVFQNSTSHGCGKPLLLGAKGTAGYGNVAVLARSHQLLAPTPGGVYTALTIDRAIADDAHIGCVHRQDHR